jgi:hypothetical protein
VVELNDEDLCGVCGLTAAEHPHEFVPLESYQTTKPARIVTQMCLATESGGFYCDGHLGHEGGHFIIDINKAENFR